MAILIPAIGTCLSRMTPGERRLAERLEEKLDDDYLLWYDVPVGPKQSHPDFVVMHPRRGLLILETKDWKLETIQEARPGRPALLTHAPATCIAPPSKSGTTLRIKERAWCANKGATAASICCQGKRCAKTASGCLGVNHGVQAATEEIVGHGTLRKGVENSQFLNKDFSILESSVLPYLPRNIFVYAGFKGFAGPTK